MTVIKDKANHYVSNEEFYKAIVEFRKKVLAAEA